LKKFDVNLEIEYDIEEIKKLKKVVISKYVKSLDEYLKKHPTASKVPIQRRIIKLINKHLVLLDSPFPLPTMQSNVTFNVIKQKTQSDIEHSFNLYVYGDYIYCFRCEFLNYYSVGDSFFIVK
jgi:hypothetical protein